MSPLQTVHCVFGFFIFGVFDEGKEKVYINYTHRCVAECELDIFTQRQVTSNGG